MAVFETWLDQDLKKPVRIQYLSGNLFSQDNMGNLIGVNVTDDGAPATLGGSVSANVIRADGATVAVDSGVLSGNRASVTLPQAAYAVPGVITVVIKITSGTDVTTLAAVVTTVYRSSTDTIVDPGTIIPSIQTLISQIETAVASIPSDYSSLWTTLAPAYSTSATYAVGQYVTYNGGLYRCTTAITSAESWTAAHWTAAKVGNDLSDLKSALNAMNGDESVDVTEFENTINLNGATAGYSSGKVKLYGTVGEASRYLLCFNEEVKAKTGSGTFEQTLPVGCYRINIKATGNAPSDYVPQASYTKTTFSSGTLIGDGAVILADAPIMIGVQAKAGTNYGTSENATYIECSVTKIFEKANEKDVEETFSDIRTMLDATFCGKSKDATAIPDYSNFNNYTTPGSFKVISAASAATMINSPNTEHAGRLYVFTGGATAYVNQLFITDFEPLYYLRSYTSQNGWSDWSGNQEFISFIDIVNNNPYTNTFTQSDLITGQFVKYETGEIGTNSNYAYSGYVRIPNGTRIIKHDFACSTTGSAGWYLYDKDKNPITNSGGKGSTVYCTQECAYVAISEQISQFSESVHIEFYGVVANKGNVGKNIVMIGDSIIGAFRGHDSVPSFTENYSGAKCVNCGFGGTAMANDTHGGSDPDRETFTGWRILTAIANNNYDDQDASIEGQSQYIQEHEHYADSIANLKSVDWSKVDILTISYGTNDFGLYNQLPDNQNNLYDTDTFGGAFRTGLEAFMTAYPHIRVVIFSPIWRAAVSNGQITTDFSKDKGGRPNGLWEYVAKEEEIAKYYQLPYKDMFYTTGFNAFTWKTYFPQTDATHPNATGRKTMGKMYADFLAAY